MSKRPRLHTANVSIENLHAESATVRINIELAIDKAWLQEVLERFKPDPNQPKLFDKETS